MTEKKAVAFSLFGLLFACGPTPGSETTGGSDTGATAATSPATSAGPGSSPTSAGTTGTSATTGGATVSGSGSDTSHDDTGTFISQPDLGPDESECDQTLEGCADGEKCNVYYDEGDGNLLGNLACFPIDPAAIAIGETCDHGDVAFDGVDNCVEGSTCWGQDDDGFGVCIELCHEYEANVWGCPETGNTCHTCQSCWVGVCLPSCDPLLNDCNDNELCTPDYEGSFSCVLDASGGTHPEGSACEFINECNAGLACLDPALYPSPECEGAAGCCVPYCDWGEFDVDLDGVADQGDPSSVCPLPGTACASWWEDIDQAPVEVAGVGACIAT